MKDVQEAYRLLPGRAASNRLTQMAKAMEIELADQTLKDAWDQICLLYTSDAADE